MGRPRLACYPGRMSNYRAHRNTLEEEAKHVLEECRVIVPGIQALIGFQMIAIFNSTFYERLSQEVRFFHLGAMGLVLIAMFLLLTPAAYHRIAEPGVVSNKFVDSSTRLMSWAMAFLRLGLAAEIYVVTRALGIPERAGAGLAAACFLLSWGLWSIYPRVSAMRLAPRTKSD
jgi:hypothetical protein